MYNTIFIFYSSCDLQLITNNSSTNMEQESSLTALEKAQIAYNQFPDRI
jgi:hypothetical protein